MKQLLLNKKEELEKIIIICEERLENVPEGTLRVTRTKKFPQFYHNIGKGKPKKYISKKNQALIRSLAQKSYDEKVLRLAKKRLTQINRLLKDYKDDEIDQIYKKEHPAKQSLIDPVSPIWEEKLEIWKNAEYKSKGFRADIPVILTDRGERVRSKSEKIIADFLYRNGIEYKYECPKYLDSIGIIYPDFTFLNQKTGEEIYWEHFGMVDVPTYAKKMVKKIETYENNNLFIGENLICTYETEESIISSKKIQQIVDKYLK